jgi:hypothetical protein
VKYFLQTTPRQLLPDLARVTWRDAIRYFSAPCNVDTAIAVFVPLTSKQLHLLAFHLIDLPHAPFPNPHRRGFLRSTSPSRSQRRSGWVRLLGQDCPFPHIQRIFIFSHFVPRNDYPHSCSYTPSWLHHPKPMNANRYVSYV